jgi:HSP20 family protein
MRQRDGRPRRFPSEQIAEVVAVACELPARHERPLGRFSRTELHRLVIEQGVTEASPTTVWRWLHDRSLKPWQQRSWIFPRDRDFQCRAAAAIEQRLPVMAAAVPLMGNGAQLTARRLWRSGGWQRTTGSHTRKAPAMLMRFDPFRELDRLADQLATRAPRAFPMDAYQRGDRFIVEFDLPGIEPAAIELTVEQNVLTVRAERSFEPREGDEVIVAERPQGTYTRQMFLGDTLDSEHLQANCQHGVLTLTIPVAATAKPRRVPISAGQDAQAIEPLTAAGATAGPAERPVSTAGQAAPSGES